ncbi:MAG TPA: ABC transporter ATP-binding protein [Thermodesulfobacteriota bacterium]|nr:ABC transporter ATP-binding protein [Thermodesulfobacteriota bacterium]
MALLEVAGLTKMFGGLTAVSELTFDIQPGELLSIIGPNGAGKTTLFNLLTGFYRPTSGTITFNAIDITGCKPYQVTRHGIGRTFQLTSIFKKSTVLENVLIGKSLHAAVGVWGSVLRTPATRREERKIRENAREILSFVGLGDKEDKVAGSLTEEAQKRLSISMALATEPKLLLLDEPTGGVNLEEISGLIDLVGKIRKSGTSICLIEHKMRMVMTISDRIVVLNYGKKIAEGAPKEVASNNEVIKAYLGERYAA